MEDLIKSLRIFSKYITDDYGRKNPTTCEHDMLFVNCVRHEQVSEEDREELKTLGFVPYEDFVFISYRFGNN